MDRASACAQDIAQATGQRARACATARDACDGAQLVVTTTPATMPVLTLQDVDRGTHVTAMGSDAPHKRELSDDLIFAADAVAVDDRAQSLVLGELRAVAGKLSDVRLLTTLGAQVGAHSPLRQSLPAGAITICDLTGTGAQDTAIAIEAMHRLGRAA